MTKGISQSDCNDTLTAISHFGKTPKMSFPYFKTNGG